MAILKNWMRRDYYYDVSNSRIKVLDKAEGHVGFGFQKVKDFFGVYRNGDHLIVCVNGKEFDVDKDACGIKYSANPFFERVKILSNKKEILNKTYWRLKEFKLMGIAQPMDSIDEEQELFFPWLKKVIEKKITFQVK